MEHVLKRGMQAVGGVVEKAIGKAQAAKKSVVETASSDGPAATLESKLPLPKVKELIRMAVERLIPTTLPTLKDRRVLEIGDGVGRFAPTMKEHGAKMVVATEIGGGSSSPIADAVRGLYVVRAAVHRLPFADGTFDFGVANLLTNYQGNFLGSLKEISRVMAPGGTLVVTDFHPFGPYARRGTSRVRPTESSFRGVGDYYKAARLAGLKVHELCEAFIDETIRPAFTTPEEKQVYRALRDTPVILCLIAKKGMIEAAA